MSDTPGVEYGVRRAAKRPPLTPYPGPLPAAVWERGCVLWHTVPWRGRNQRGGRCIYRRGEEPAQVGLATRAPGVDPRRTRGRASPCPCRHTRGQSDA